MTASAPVVFDLRLPAITLEGGGVVDPLIVRGWSWGPADETRAISARARVLQEGQVREQAWRIVRRTRLELEDFPPPPIEDAPAVDPSIPTIVIIHALTGDMRAGGPGGWWEPVIGPGRALDPTRFRLLCFNNLGGCYGTSGPADAWFPFAPTWSPAPATVTTWDQAQTILASLHALGIGEAHLATGGSLGAMASLCLAALGGDRIQRIAPFAGCESASAWLIGWNHVARQILMLDPGYPDDADRGLEVARQLAMLTYRAEPGLQEHHGRDVHGGGNWSSDARYEVQSYLEHQGAKLRQRFHPLSYVTQLGAMDHHDLGREPGTAHGGFSWGLDRITARAFVVGIDTDQLYRPEQSGRLAVRLRERGLRVEEATIHSLHGHDAFLIEWPQVDAALRAAVAL